MQVGEGEGNSQLHASLTLQNAQQQQRGPDLTACASHPASSTALPVPSLHTASSAVAAVATALPANPGLQYQQQQQQPASAVPPAAWLPVAGVQAGLRQAAESGGGFSAPGPDHGNPETAAGLRQGSSDAWQGAAGMHMLPRPHHMPPAPQAALPRPQHTSQAPGGVPTSQAPAGVAGPSCTGGAGAGVSEGEPVRPAQQSPRGGHSSSSGTPQQQGTCDAPGGCVIHDDSSCLLATMADRTCWPYDSSHLLAMMTHHTCWP